MDDALVLAKKLRQDWDRLDSNLRALTEHERSAPVYTEGAVWTVRNVVTHMMSAERAFLHLFREIREGGLGVDEGFSVDGFNAREQTRFEQLSWDELLGSFQKVRARMIDFVATLASKDLEKVGRHPFLGVTSLREMVKLIYIHDQTHLRDLRRALGSS